MSVDDIVKLFDAITKLLNVLIWPAIILFILIRFGRELRDFFSSLGELSLKGAGFEASLKRKQAEVVAALSAAAASKPDGDKTRESVAKEVMIAADVVADFVTPRAIRRASRSTVLWVDDNPNNNSYERQALEALGVSFVLAISTDEALKKISRQRFDAIISDMGRPPDPRAGYTLLDKLRSSGDQTPFIIYASSREQEHVAESRRHGAIGCTNNANELFEMVLSALGRSA
ncbi:MAG: response regulator [Microcystis panniformis Mp_MB_F_20051200_S9]|uniref:Response regulator n=1 Tax=Microcystis panniformis Mp_MB_F_20051200_S9 TaxID=2486223 RepID=A0A552Q249_9CHRO|nr:MAG: response regulator [Microcystis panniformis Mp_MB_F_20080800_S26D]TRV45172.1 MAG: response regulator [Microcystis panniformis Mp_GB_SS_20050300_S99]TRV55693.1 MAG: response regulator [Microcystis panniformis Mp_GB_SS_20050300_S99D]TRV57303.1 MAG: response regulator [Microcystis panniformis Mp_MB_F_20080800_S26]TRV60732.1 MAG: response regulator [Microcystis panniformis Mp_MB_F_20051200_S9D]TRV63300.1 MAG: response regulator [Microcystis panniformis Mp_MB_F_20051200_S9]TRV68257.1 MAG: 